MKTCKKCNIEKSLEDFSPDKRGLFGRYAVCKTCRKQVCKDYNLRNPEKRRETITKYYSTHKAEVIKRTLKSRKINAQTHASYKRAKKKYRATLRGKSLHAFYQRTRDATQRQATPSWANLNKIRLIYLKCPRNMEVDHIIPLKGKNVCGLHVDYNLQYLTKSENSRKGNRCGG